MQTEEQRTDGAAQAGGTADQSGARTGVLVGLAIGLGVLAWMAARQPRDRRFGDQGEERRRPQNFFAAGSHPRRRAIDQSGRRPLFERRQSVYESL